MTYKELIEAMIDDYQLAIDAAKQYDYPYEYYKFLAEKQIQNGLCYLLIFKYGDSSYYHWIENRLDSTTRYWCLTPKYYSCSIQKMKEVLQYRLDQLKIILENREYEY